MDPKEQNPTQQVANIGQGGVPIQPQPVVPQNPQPQIPPQQPGPQVIDAPKTANTKANPNSTQNTLLIAEVRDGIVIMNDGSYRAVVFTKSTNFDLMSPQEREAIEFAYQGFLNSLYFDVQFFIRSRKVDIQPYIDKLDKLRLKQENMLLSLMMEDYMQYIASIASETNIMDKQFYIVVPYSKTVTAEKAVSKPKNFVSKIFSRKQGVVRINEKDLQEAKDELKNRVGAVLDGLQQMGLQAIALDTQELIELYYDAYNPDTATHQKMRDLSGLESPVVSKGEGFAPQPNISEGTG